MDRCALGAAVVREACRLAAERALGRLAGPGRLPGTLAEVTAPWLDAALREHVPGAHVRAVTLADASAGTTDRARVTLTYESTPPADAPGALFVKLAPAAFATRLFGDVLGLGATEVRFYREVAPSVPVEVPRVYLAATARGGRRFVLVLEDLAARGAAFGTVAEDATLELATAVLDTLARLHAAFWNSPRRDRDLAWLRAPGRNPTLRVERALCALAARPGMRRFPEAVPAAVRAAAPRIVGARDRLDVLWARGDLTLLHGDAHVGNLYFVDGRVGLLDWQVAQWGPAMRDVSYFLVTSLPTATRRVHERALIAHYLASLARGGVAPPTFADAWRQHRLLACHAWIAAIVTAAAGALQAAPIARAGVARASEALVDLDSLAALAEIGA